MYNQAMQQELKYIDETTKLYNRKYFVDNVPRFLEGNRHCICGVNIIISINGIVQANEEVGYLRVNDFFLKIANTFITFTREIENVIISRMNGTEFCIFLPKCSDKKALNIAREILYNIEQLHNTSLYL